MDPTAFRSQFGVEPPDVAAGARLAALRFAVRDRAALGEVMRGAGTEFAHHMGRIVVAPKAAMGATLVFA
jgi:hypothetical protein